MALDCGPHLSGSRRKTLRRIVSLLILILSIFTVGFVVARSSAVDIADSPAAYAYDGPSQNAMKASLRSAVAERMGARDSEPSAVTRAKPVLFSDNGTAAKTGGRLTENGIGSAMEDILATASPGKASKSIQFSKPGGYDAAKADFDVLTQGSEVIERGGGLLTSTLSNGMKVNVRPFSSGKFPTLEIVTPGNPAIKIGY